MQVILTKDVEALGEQGDVVQVSDGYARNYLLPRQVAILASAGALKDLESRREQIKAKAEKRYQEDLKRKEEIEALGTLVVEANVGEEGKLFGTITPKDISQILEQKSEYPIDRKNILLSGAVNRVGTYEVGLRLSPRVTAKLQLEVTASATQEKQSIIDEIEAEEAAAAEVDYYEEA